MWPVNDSNTILWSEGWCNNLVVNVKRCKISKNVTELLREPLDLPPKNGSLIYNFPLFKHPKSFLDGKQFQDKNEVWSIITQWLQYSKTASFIDEGFIQIAPLR
ncbi:hypothetical protein TNCV_1195401 [Trichonephila clavipes]|nr:hypothetical protein TNCV_1195401 [Trichonephila clavipes]